MKNYFRLHYKHRLKFSVACLLYLSTLFTPTVFAHELQCDLAENSYIKPAILVSMKKAADSGYLYYVNASASNVGFQVNHFPFSTVKGRFKQFQGGLTLPEQSNKSNQALFVIKVDSIATGDSDLDDYLKSAEFFDEIQYPDIIFVSTGFEWLNKTTARLQGKLTLRGTTKPLTFNVHVISPAGHSINKNNTMTMMASAEIKRSDFGMHEMQLFVSDTVRFELKLEASKSGG